ncbi:MAG: hypothetical protein ACYCYM_12370 [Saccharofermentanales bacterium]
MKRTMKFLLVGFITTIIRIIGQLFIPSYEQNVLAPSVFVKQGIMPITFLIYAFFGFSVISAMYLLVEKRMTGSKISKGLKYGAAYCVIWTAYLFEPLPHSAGADFINAIAYPIADGIALLVMGLLIGILIAKDSDRMVVEKKKYKFSSALLSLVFMTICFMAGRIFQYAVMDIYSSFDASFLITLLWVTITGITVSAVLLWFNQFVSCKNKIKRALIIGGILYGINMIIFNFFIPLVFDFDVMALLTRTLVEICFVTVGALSLPDKLND